MDATRTDERGMEEEGGGRESEPEDDDMEDDVELEELSEEVWNLIGVVSSKRTKNSKTP